MGWFSKKEKVPEIPPAPRLPDLPEPPRPSNELPSLPGSFNENINQEMVKSAVGDSSGEKGDHFEELPQDFHFQEEAISKEIIPEIPTKSKMPIQNEDQRKTLELSPVYEPKTKLAEPIFVRIDKFQAAQKDFETIKKSIREIELTLKKLNEGRLKEEEEISSWGQELEKVKSRLSEIDSSIFNKL